MSKAERRRQSIFDALREQIKELENRTKELETALVERPSWDLKECCVEALCDVSVAANEVLVTADLPNIDPNTIKVEKINESTLEIRAEMKRKVRFEELGIRHREGEFRFFRCQTVIPVQFETKGMSKRLTRGILELHLPRKKTRIAKR